MINTGPIEVYGNARRYEFNKDPLLFLDNSFLESARSVERIWYQPTKRPEPVLVADRQWESHGKYHCVGGFSGRAIVNRNGKLRMFYSIYHMDDKLPEFRSFAMAESDDGVHWKKQEKPLIVNKRGKRGAKHPYYEMQNVMWDDHSSRYICMGHCAINEKKAGTFYGWSDDPTKWEKKNFTYAYPNEDIHSLLGWNETRHQYESFPRILDSKADRATRAIGFSTSKDFKTWKTPIQCYRAQFWDKRTEIYNMPVDKIGPYYLGFPIIYFNQENGFGPLETWISISMSGVTWTDAGRWIERGRPGEWDDCYAMTASPVNFKDQTLFYYWGCNFPHDEGFREEPVNNGFVGLATLPRDRYCSLSSPVSAGGRIVTGLLKGKGRIYLNGRGKITIQLLKHDFSIIRSVSIDMDSLDCHTGMEVPECDFRLSITLRKAELFGVRIG
jgi:predicted GH43/DUF377 family glycosyl hydrolase